MCVLACGKDSQFGCGGGAVEKCHGREAHSAEYHFDLNRFDDQRFRLLRSPGTTRIIFLIEGTEEQLKAYGRQYVAGQRQISIEG